jgi:hypothetical protein
MSDHRVGQCPITCPITQRLAMLDNPNARLAMMMLHRLTDEATLARIGLMVASLKDLPPDEKARLVNELILAGLQRMNGGQS